MIIIQTLCVLYKAITDDLKKGNEEATKSTKMVAKELNETDKFTKALQKSFKSLAAEITGVLGVAFTAGEFFRTLKDAADFGKNLSLSSNLLNINASELQAWGNIIQKVGGKAEDFQKNLQAIGSYYNVTPDIALRAIPYLTDSFQKLNRLQAFTQGHNMGIDDHMIQLLRLGNTELSKMLMAQKDLGLLTEADVEKFVAFNSTIVDTKNAFMGLTTSLVSDAIPSLNTAFENLTKGLVYLRNNKDELKDAVVGIITGIGLAIAVSLPELTLFAAGIGLLVVGFEKLKSAHDSFKGSGNFLEDILTGTSASDLKNGDKKLSITGDKDWGSEEFSKAKYHPSISVTPLAKTSASMIDNSSKTNSNVSTINIGKVVTPDAKTFTRQMAPHSRRAAFDDYNQGLNMSATGEA